MPKPTTLPEPWRELAKRLGGVAIMAEAMGTVPRTVNHWANGTRKPGGSAQKLIRTVFEAEGFTPPEF
jgi:hypothetical protein